MRFDELWTQVLNQNPTLKHSGAHMSEDNFKKALLLAYNTGARHRANTSAHVATESCSVVDDLMGMLNGRGR